MKKRTGVIFLALGGFFLIGAVAAVVGGVIGLIDTLKPIAVVEAPGSIEVELVEPGPYTLWHDHTTISGGMRTSHHQDLPSGFTFNLTHLDSGTPAGFKAIGGSATQTMSTADRESVGLGTFQVANPGTYKLDASNPAGDQRSISLTQGTILSSIGSFFSSFGIAALLGLLGIAGLVIGLIGVLAGRGKSPAVPPPVS